MNSMVPTSGKASRLRDLVERPGTDFLLEAHSGLSARIVEEAGFPGIWASSLAISAMLGVRDANEASWTEVLDVLGFMCDATDIPILMDADSGYGNFNNVRRLVRKAEQVGVAGLCIEDKLFPKANSFVDSATNQLAGVEEFCGRIRAAVDSRRDPDTTIIARTEAMVVGCSVNEALDRAEAYREAGADGVLPHSKDTSPVQVLQFLEAWDRRAPVVLVPTTYSETSARTLEAAGTSVIIWANHTLRASITAMQRVATAIKAQASVQGVAAEIATIPEIFRLQGMQELKEAEKKYLEPGGAELAGLATTTFPKA